MTEPEDALSQLAEALGGAEEEEGVMNEIQQHAMAWYTEKVPDPKCPSCTEEAWLISSTLHTYPAFDPQSGGVFFEDGLTLVMFICGNCAFTRSYNASVMGIAD